MKLIKKGDQGSEPGKEPEVFHYPWEAGMAALASGEYDVHGYPREDRGPDQPGAQTPAPGTDPLDGKEEAREGTQLTNVEPATSSSMVDAGLPKDPVPPKSVIIAAPTNAGAAAKPGGK